LPDAVNRHHKAGVGCTSPAHAGSLGGFGASRIRLNGETKMTKNLLIAALLSTTAAFSFAQAPAKAVAPAGATVAVAAPAAETAKPAAKKAAKKHSKKKAAKAASAAK
jgi:hypothetical protein